MIELKDHTQEFEFKDHNIEFPQIILFVICIAPCTVHFGLKILSLLFNRNQDESSFTNLPYCQVFPAVRTQ